MPPEVDVDNGSALTYRNDLALNQRKPAALGQHLGGVFGVERFIVRTGPKAKLVPAGALFPAKELSGAGVIPGADGDEGQHGRNKLGLQENFAGGIGAEAVSAQPPVPIGRLRFGLAEYDFASGKPCGQRLPRRLAAARGRVRPVGPGQWWNLNAGKPHLAPVGEHKASSVERALCRAVRNYGRCSAAAPNIPNISPIPVAETAASTPSEHLTLPQKPGAGMRRYLGDSRASWGLWKAS